MVNEIQQIEEIYKNKYRTLGRCIECGCWESGLKVNNEAYELAFKLYQKGDSTIKKKYSHVLEQLASNATILIKEIEKDIELKKKLRSN